ncbi:MAG: HD domain-containing protein [Proteobacteria bacterium]|nr:HD domain-containing protein [Pseudomonadota bacterium]MBU4471033.1 HD domain-containing protein [Pseudomonadota bacterium]MCG2753633.1 HD domain-containing protein [Desulfobacteraceae bacterium]
MNIQFRFIKSKIGRRIFSMFALCALLPIALLGAISYFQVSEQLQNQNYDRLQKEAKSHGLAIFERLNFLESDLQIIGVARINQIQAGALKNESLGEGAISNRFKAISILNSRGEVIPVQGSVDLNYRKPTPPQEDHMKAGNTLLWVLEDTGTKPRMLMLQPLPSADPAGGYLVGEIALDYLWGENIGNRLSPLTDVFILGPSKEFLYSTVDNPAPFVSRITNRISKEFSGFFEVRDEQEDYSLVYRMLFMQPKFLMEGFMVVLRQPQSFILQPLMTFRITFWAVVITSFLVVLWLSIVYIRRRLIPLDALKEGMLRISKKDFQRSVILNSGDEFEELASHFNQMTTQLDHQFKTILARAEIDRSILSSMKMEEIIEVTLKGMQSIFMDDSIAISLIPSVDNNESKTYAISMNDEKVRQIQVSYNNRDIEILKTIQRHRVYRQGEEMPDFLSRFKGLNHQRFLVLPVILNEKPAAAIALARQSSAEYKEENIAQARQMADQVAVALSNSMLLEELNSLGWGTLMAFGRAVDAKSPWTAGHSERVSMMAVRIGRRLGLNDRKLDMLERAGLLHDIGKIGVPAYILDKPGKLTAEEMNVIKKHPVIGARILEPIKVFLPIIPMILQHHEQFEGNGYPNGLSGTKIDLCARILSIADVFDALISDRPYRTAMPLEKAMNIMVDESGRMFDPEVLEAFLDIVESKKDLLVPQDLFIENHVQLGP